MLELLLTLMVALVPFQRRFIRAVAAIPFIVLTFAHYFWAEGMSAEAYYGSALLGSIIALALVIRLPSGDPVVRLIGFSCMLSAVLNAFGYLLWLGYFPSIIYNSMFLGLYGIVVVALCKGVHSGSPDTRSPNAASPIDKIHNLFSKMASRGQR